MDKKIELKPCPFCGRKAAIAQDNYDKYMVMCSCGVMIGVELEDGCELVDGWRATFETKDKAVEAWNGRIDHERNI